MNVYRQSSRKFIDKVSNSISNFLRHYKIKGSCKGLLMASLITKVVDRLIRRVIIFFMFISRQCAYEGFCTDESWKSIINYYKYNIQILCGNYYFLKNSYFVFEQNLLNKTFDVPWWSWCNPKTIVIVYDYLRKIFKETKSRFWEFILI